jgi:hypothetical protein
MADSDGVARKTFATEGTAEEGGSRAERLRESVGFVRSITEGAGTPPDEAPGTLDNIRRDEGIGGGLEVEERTTIAPASADTAPVSIADPRSPPIHGLRRMAQL